MRKKIKRQIISIDKNSRIVIDPRNYILQFRRNSERLLTWRDEGSYPDLTSLCLEYLNSYPQRSDKAISSLEEIVQEIKEAESKICKVTNKI